MHASKNMRSHRENEKVKVKVNVLRNLLEGLFRFSLFLLLLRTRRTQAVMEANDGNSPINNMREHIT